MKNENEFQFVFGSKEAKDGKFFKMFFVWFDGGIREILMNRETFKF